MLRHAEPPTTPSYLERPSPWGMLRLDIEDPDRVPDFAHTPAEIAEAERALETAQLEWDPDDPEATVAAMRAIARDWPLWVGGHGASFTILMMLARPTEAVWHLRQAIAALPVPDLLIRLARHLRDQGRFDAAACIHLQLWSQRATLHPHQAQGSATGALICLHKLGDFEGAVSLAAEAIGAIGHDPELIMHHLINLLRLQRRDEATRAWAAYDPHFPRDSLLRRSFDELRHMLGGPPQA